MEDLITDCNTKYCNCPALPNHPRLTLRHRRLQRHHQTPGKYPECILVSLHLTYRLIKHPLFKSARRSPYSVVVCPYHRSPHPSAFTATSVNLGKIPRECSCASPPIVRSNIRCSKTARRPSYRAVGFPYSLIASSSSRQRGQRLLCPVHYCDSSSSSFTSPSLS